MAKRKNPKSNHPGLGAFLGSIIGSVPGVAFKSPALFVLGSTAGAGVGGYMGAASDRERRGAIGGAVGGALLGPIGAAAGGYIGGRKPDAKKKNPTAGTYALAIGVGLAAVGGGYLVKKDFDRRKAKKKELPPADAVKEVLGTAALADSPFVVGDVQQPILLRTTAQPLPIDDVFDRVPELKVLVPMLEGGNEVLTPAGAAFGVDGELGSDDSIVAIVAEDGDIALVQVPDKAIAHLVTGLSPDANRLAYELALVHIGEKDVDWGDPQQMDTAIAQILTTIAPKTDWREGLKPHTYGSAAWKAWVGVQIMGTVANQSLINKRNLIAP